MLQRIILLFFGIFLLQIFFFFVFPATIDVKRNIYALSVSKYGTQISLVENMGEFEQMQESCVKIYDVGRKRDHDDDAVSTANITYIQAASQYVAHRDACRIVCIRDGHCGGGDSGGTVRFCSSSPCIKTFPWIAMLIDRNVNISNIKYIFFQ